MDRPSKLPAEPVSLPLSQEEVERELHRILSSDTFSRSERMKRFLEFTVSMVFQGRGDELKEYSIGVAAFDKPSDFDPRMDPIVRVEAGRLRTKLKEYYETEGHQDPILVQFRKRSYIPHFEPRAAESLANELVLTAAASFPTAGPTLMRNDRPMRSVAVLAFADLSPKQNQGYFCDGITEELINVLSRVDGLRVAARTTVMQFKNNAADIRSIGQQLNVQAVLEGSVRKEGNRIRISTQLINVADGYNLWSDVYDQELKGIFEVQRNIAQSIVRALGLRVNSNSSGDTSRTTPRDFRVYKLYLQGNEHSKKRDPAALRSAVRCFQRAIERDPDYALAHAGLADAYAALAWAETLAPEIAWQRSLQSAERALELDPRLAPAFNALGAIRAAYHWDWAGSEEAFQQAIKYDADHAPVHHWYALFCLTPQRRFEEAERQLHIARDLDPMLPIGYVYLGWLHYYRREWKAALECAEDCLDLDKGQYAAHSLAGYVHLAQGLPEQALASFRAALGIQRQDPMSIGGAGRSCALMKDRRKAKAYLERLKRSRSGYVPETDVAQIYAGQGERDAAFEWLKRAADRRCPRLIGLRVDPAYDRLRTDPRFADLMERLGLNH